MKYIVEHLEGPLEEWATLEYIHMCQIVGDINLEFTNFPNDNGGETLDFGTITRTNFHPKLIPSPINKYKSLIDWSKTCLLDMDAPQPLTSHDKYDTVVFGGILGNVPSDDRTAELRKLNFDYRRHLGPVQMTTNTAILVSKIILEDGVSLEQIPYIDSPEIQLGIKEFIELPFRFVAKSYLTKNEADRNIPIMAEGMIEYLKESSNDVLDF